MNRLPAYILKSLLIVFVMAAVIVTGVSTYRYSLLSQEVDLLRSASKDDSTWGLYQLNIELLKFSSALNEFASNNSPEVRQSLALRLDILYSRFDVVSEVLARSKVTATEHRAVSIYPENNVFILTLDDEFQKVRDVFAAIDSETQNLLAGLNLEKLPAIQKHVDNMVTLTSEFSSLGNQASNQREFNLRESVLSHMHEYQLTLLTIVIGVIFFSGTSFLLFLKAREAEKISRNAAAELRLANEAKTHFLSAMSHELRTPLNAIIGFTQLIGIKLGSVRSKEVQEYEGYVLSSAEHLLELIDQVLDLEKIETGNLKLEIRNCELEEIISQSIQMINPIAEKSNIAVNVNGSCNATVTVDDFRARQILLNLLSNAVKYNIPGGSINVTCDVADDYFMTISVVDTGSGIPPDKVDSLFEPFNRLGREAGTIQGTGIGLSICRSLATLMNADVGYKPNPEGGSVFWLSLPMSREI